MAEPTAQKEEPTEEFALLEATANDIEDICNLAVLAHADDELYKPMVRDMSARGEYKLWEYHIAPRFDQDAIGEKSFKIVQIATGKLVGYTQLAWPRSRTEEEKKDWDTMLKARELPPIAGLDPYIAEFYCFRQTEFQIESGADEEEHFTRHGTFVHPEFQRRGLGTWLCRHCNEIADTYGAAMYVSARPASKKMFQNVGFEVVGELKLDMSRYGLDEDVSHVLKRDPQPQ
ncbi:hypothetical protein BU16DRAFT_343418 [Lophium mytilinum]|uniref:N-acetyltransferase domain-containing protein n=1 Tax=Lophium mytilinum TaxID=390894 RepID=A0A6A6QWS2_9PEZI|nr:hypothetical protein BU16DRAFT_343418 [Lophium mytilinum]